MITAVQSTRFASMAVAVAAAVLLAPSGASAQKSRDASCKVQATQRSLQGAEREQFMNACLGKKAPASVKQGKTAAATESPTQRCTREAKARGLEGVARQAFMKGCTKT